MSVQTRNADLVELLSADFPRRNEPLLAWGNALSAFSLLHGLRGLWPFTGSAASGAVNDLSGNGLALTRNGTASLQVNGLAPNALFTSIGSDYYSRADAAILDISGTEAFIASNARGLTIGGWFLNTVAPGALSSMGMFGKWNQTGNQRSYLIDFVNGGAGTCFFRFRVSNDGTATAAQNSSVAIPTGSWYFVTGRFIPSTEVSVFVNTSKDTNAVGIPAAIFNSTSPLAIGAEGAPANYFDGRAAMCFLCAAALSDTVIRALYEITRPLFGVR